MKKFLLTCFIVLFSCRIKNCWAQYEYWRDVCIDIMEKNLPAIEIIYNYGELKYNVTKSSQELTQQKNDPRYKNITGLANSNFKETMSIKSETKLLGNKYYCQYPIHVQYTYKQIPFIYLSKSTKEHKCHSIINKRHELQHQANRYIFINHFINEIRNNFRTFIFEIGPQFSDRMPSENNFRNVYYDYIHSVQYFHDNELNHYTNMMDNKDNYHYESSLCSGKN